MSVLSAPIECPECTVPVVTTQSISATCLGGVSQDNGQLEITSSTVGTAYNYSMGSSYGPVNSILSSNQTFDPSTALSLQFGSLASLSVSQDYTIRVFNEFDGCFTDVTVALQGPQIVQQLAY